MNSEPESVCRTRRQGIFNFTVSIHAHVVDGNGPNVYRSLVWVLFPAADLPTHKPIVIKSVFIGAAKLLRA